MGRSSQMLGAVLALALALGACNGSDRSDETGTSTATTLPGPPSSAAAPPGTTWRVSVSSTGTEGDGHSGFSPALSDDGTIAAFASEATNLVPDDTNGVGDIFVHDSTTGQTERVSVSSDGDESDGYSYTPALSADGAIVAFVSDGTNLVAGDDNGRGDVFVHDRTTGTTERISVSSEGVGGNALSAATRAPGISADGRYVAFQSFADNLVDGDTNDADDVFLRDRNEGTTVLVTRGVDGPADGASYGPALSADGQFVTFASAASNLVEGDDNGRIDQFVHELATGRTELVGTAHDGAPSDGDVAPFSGSSLSSDGRVVAFVSTATNLVPGDTNEVPDVFVVDREDRTITRVSVASDGSEGNGESGFPALDATGQVVVFESVADDLVADDRNALNDVFLHRRAGGMTERVGRMFDPLPDVPAGGGPNRADTFFKPALTPDGTHVAFQSEATTIVDHDTNGVADVFVVVVGRLS